MLTRSCQGESLFAGHGQDSLQAREEGASSPRLAHFCLEIVERSTGPLYLLNPFTQAALMNLQGKLKAQQENFCKWLLQEMNRVEKKKWELEIQRKQKRTETMQDRHRAAASVLLCLGRERWCAYPLRMQGSKGKTFSVLPDCLRPYSSANQSSLKSVLNCTAFLSVSATQIARLQHIPSASQ